MILKQQTILLLVVMIVIAVTVVEANVDDVMQTVKATAMSVLSNEPKGSLVGVGGLHV
jgi:hypothetical protein